jgi:hypothetical protein
MGVGDAVDIGWKLAAVLQGWGGEALLDSYMIERRPVHQKVIEEAMANTEVLTQNLVRADLEADSPEGEAVRAELGAEILDKKRREFSTLGVVLGICYDGSPVIADEAGPRPTWHFADYQPSAMPGALAPHLWLAPGCSLYDLFGQGFTLLVTGAGSEADVAALSAEAVLRGLPLKVITPNDARLGPLYEARMALIRPDQIVAWRGDHLDRGAADLLNLVSGMKNLVAALRH